MRRTMRVIMITPATPASAGAIRQPSEFVRYCDGLPSHRYSEKAISHFPSGGWTMNM